MSTDTDTYAMLETRDWPQVVVTNSSNGRRQPHHHPSHHHHRLQQQQELQYGELSLKSLKKDWHGVVRNIGTIG